jgi:hypothetical protein
MSFAVIGIMWQNHHALFRLIVKVDRMTILLNLTLLCSWGLRSGGFTIGATGQCRICAQALSEAAFGAKPLANPVNLAFTLREGRGVRMDRILAQNQRMRMLGR